jgi:hypothetical protein
MPYIGDDHLTTAQYQELREKYRDAQTTVPWMTWAKRYISPTGARDRALIKAKEDYEAGTAKAFWAGEKAQREAMAAEFDPVADQEAAIRRAGRNYGS